MSSIHGAAMPKYSSCWHTEHVCIELSWPTDGQQRNSNQHFRARIFELLAAVVAAIASADR